MSEEIKKDADQDFLEFLVKSLVDHPEDVRVERKVDERGVLLTLHVHAMDMGQVVGRQGMTAKAIRSLLRIVGIKNNSRVNLKIEEPEGSTFGQQAAADGSGAETGTEDSGGAGEAGGGEV